MDGAFNSTTNDNDNYLRYKDNAAPTSGKLYVDVTIKSHEETNTRGAAFGVTDASGPRTAKRYAYLRFHKTGQIQYKHGGGWTNLTAYAANTEYAFRFILDLSTSTWALWLDGVEVATGLSFTDNAATVAGEFALLLNRYSRDNPSGTAQFDNIVVQHEPQP